MTELAAADAQLFWLAARLPNDQFLIYGADGEPAPDALAQLRRRAGACPDLLLRIADDARWRYPQWVPAAITDDQFVVHDEPIGVSGDFSAVGRLAPLDATRAAWRIHLFPPGVVVVQMSHALGDGTRSSALAAALLGRAVTPPPLAVAPRRCLPALALAAARAQRGAPAPPPPRPPLSPNAAPAGAPVLRTLLVERDRVRVPTVTVAVLAAVAEALGGYLAARGEDVSRLGAEVPIAWSPTAFVRNNFGNAGIDLPVGTGRDERLHRIAAELRAARLRAEHPAARAAAAAFAATPAWLLRWGIGRFDPAARSEAVTGNTVVSSVNRGPADLSIGGRPVRYTAGFPALSPMQRLTHGVHGLGGTVAVSVHADSGVVDVEDYLDRLGHALS